MTQKKGVDFIMVSEPFALRDDCVRWIERQRKHGNFNGNLMVHVRKDGANGDRFRAGELFNRQNPRHLAILAADEREDDVDLRFVVGVYEKSLSLAV